MPISGSWIWCSTEPNPANAYAYFRKSITLAAAPTAATVKVTADTRYALFVNGRRIGRGPARSHTKFLAFDTWDITGDLQPGQNVLAALVHHAGESTYRSQIGRAGFLCDAAITVNGQIASIRTDATWKALASNAWDRSQPRMNIALGFAEVYDARLSPAGWRETTFDDASWPAATVLGPAGMEPWTNLAPSDIPPNRETTLRPKALTSILEVEPPSDAAHIPFGRLYTRNAWAVGYASTYLYAPNDTSVSLQVGGDDGLRLWVNDALLLERTTARPGYPGQDTVTATLNAGWNRVFLKSAKLLGPWNVYVAATGPGAVGVFVSSEKDPARKDTWRISPEQVFDGSKGVLSGLNSALGSDSGSGVETWQQIVAPVAPMHEIAPLMRHETRRAPSTSHVENATALLTEAGTATFRSVGRSDGSVVLDMGRPVLGYPVLTVRNARGGEIVDVGYVEALETATGQLVSPASGAPGIVNPARQDVAYADRFICRPGDNVFEPFEKRGFRYMQVDVRNAMEPLQFGAPTVTEALYPVEERGSFSSSDERLNRIWEASRLTLRLNMDDAYTDCVWRERTQWWGDARVEALVNYYTFGDTKLVRRGLIQAAESQDSEGIVHGLFPTDWSGARLPSFSLLWVISVWEYYVHTGDASLFPVLSPAMDRLMAFFAGKINPSLGLLENVPYWVFIDWAPGMDGQRIGASASLNAFYYRALVVMADIARVRGDSTAAAAWDGKAAALKEAFNLRFWNAGQGLYDDTLNAGTPSGRYTQQANSLAVIYGIAPKERWNGIVQKITTDPNVVKVGTPYFGSFLMDAMFATGRDAEAYQMMRDRWGKMLDWGSPTFWEKWEPTDSLTHGWSSIPGMALPARLLGVRPISPGWKEWTLSPVFANLQWARGRVPTPAGDIDAFWMRRANGVQVDVAVPAGTSARIRIPLAGYETARWIVMQGTRAARDVVYESVTGAFAVRLTKPGRYTILGTTTTAAARPSAKPAARSTASPRPPASKGRR